MEPNKKRNQSRLLYGLACCCICCIIVPGIFLVTMANVAYRDWETAQAKVIDTTYCGTYRRNLGRAIENQAAPPRGPQEFNRSTGSSGYYNARSRPNSYNSKPEPKYSVTYSFATSDGQQVTATTTYCYNPVPPLGATETIMYDPQSPTVAVTSQERKEGMNIGGILMLIAGLVSLAVIGICLAVVMRATK